MAIPPLGSELPVAKSRATSTPLIYSRVIPLAAGAGGSTHTPRASHPYPRDDQDAGQEEPK